MKLFNFKPNTYIETTVDFQLPCKSEDDEEIIYKIIELSHKLSTPFIRRSNADYMIYSKIEDKIHKKIDFLDKALAIEKEDTEKAISMYETLVSEKYSYTANPYQRLAILYRKAKRYDDEIRVIKAGLQALADSGLDSFYAEFINRLEKAIILREREK